VAYSFALIAMIVRRICHPPLMVDGTSGGVEIHAVNRH
jgi:hypothetical protein